MFTLMVFLLATSCFAEPAQGLTCSGVVVDPAGRPLPDVDVVLAGRMPTVGSFPTLARTITDAQGAFRLEVGRQQLEGLRNFDGITWAYRPGRAVGLQPIELTQNGALPPVRSTLAAPLRRTVRIVGADDHPLAGVRIAPVRYATNGSRWLRDSFFTPDDRVSQLAVATGADGVATVPYLPATVELTWVRVDAPGIVPHAFPLPSRPGTDHFTLKLGRPARLAGSVFNDSGQPAASVPVEVRVENLYYLPRDPDENPKPAGLPSLIHFDSGPVRTGADGSFLTPPQLMTGRSYTIIIRPEGDPTALHILGRVR